MTKTRNYFPMNLNKEKHTIVFTDHVFDYRGNEKRIGHLTKEKVREFIRQSVEKENLLSKKNYRYVITYPRENDCFSAILVAKEGKSFVVVTIVHSDIKYQRQGLLPKEKNSVDFTEEETKRVFKVDEVKQVPKMTLRRKIRKVAI